MGNNCLASSANMLFKHPKHISIDEESRSQCSFELSVLKKDSKKYIKIVIILKLYSPFHVYCSLKEWHNEEFLFLKTLKKMRLVESLSIILKLKQQVKYKCDRTLIKYPAIKEQSNFPIFWLHITPLILLIAFIILQLHSRGSSRNRENGRNIQYTQHQLLCINLL